MGGRFHGPLEALWLSSQIVGALPARGVSGANQGFSSQTSTWVMANAVPVALALKPDAIALQAGINDGVNSDVVSTPSPTDTTIFNNIVGFYNQCCATAIPGAIGYTVPIMMTVIPTDSANGKPAPNAVNKLIRDRFGNDPKCIFIDAASILLDGAPYGFVAANRFHDTLHLSTLGELILAMGVARTSTAISRPASRTG